MFKSFLALTSFVLLGQQAFATVYNCNLHGADGVKVTGKVDTTNAKSYTASSDSKTNLIIVCAALTDAAEKPIGMIGCGVMTPNGTTSLPSFKFSDFSATSEGASSWEAISFASDVSPMTGVSFTARDGAATSSLGAICAK